VTIIDSLNDLWNTILQTMSMFVIPDWNAIIGLLPILIFLGVVGPLITFLFLGIVAYQVRKPRVKGVRFEEGPTVAEIGEDGQPVFPPGLPHCRRDALIYPSGTIRCERCRDELAVICPMCGLGRPAARDTCTNCGLVLKIRPREVVVRSSSAGPKPGGAAVA
jgi:hypothetical protein